MPKGYPQQKQGMVSQIQKQSCIWRGFSAFLALTFVFSQVQPALALRANQLAENAGGLEEVENLLRDSRNVDAAFTAGIFSNGTGANTVAVPALNETARTSSVVTTGTGVSSAPVVFDLPIAPTPIRFNTQAFSETSVGDIRGTTNDEFVVMRNGNDAVVVAFGQTENAARQEAIVMYERDRAVVQDILRQLIRDPTFVGYLDVLQEGDTRTLLQRLAEHPTAASDFLERNSAHFGALSNLVDEQGQPTDHFETAAATFQTLLADFVAAGETQDARRALASGLMDMVRLSYLETLPDQIEVAREYQHHEASVKVDRLTRALQGKLARPAEIPKGPLDTFLTRYSMWERASLELYRLRDNAKRRGDRKTEEGFARLRDAIEPIYDELQTQLRSPHADVRAAGMDRLHALIFDAFYPTLASAPVPIQGERQLDLADANLGLDALPEDLVASGWSDATLRKVLELREQGYNTTLVVLGSHSADHAKQVFGRIDGLNVVSAQLNVQDPATRLRATDTVLNRDSANLAEARETVQFQQVVSAAHTTLDTNALLGVLSQHAGLNRRMTAALVSRMEDALDNLDVEAVEAAATSQESVTISLAPAPESLLMRWAPKVKLLGYLALALSGPLGATELGNADAGADDTVPGAANADAEADNWDWAADPASDVMSSDEFLDSFSLDEDATPEFEGELTTIDVDALLSVEPPELPDVTLASAAVVAGLSQPTIDPIDIDVSIPEPELDSGVDAAVVFTSFMDELPSADVLGQSIVEPPEDMKDRTFDTAKAMGDYLVGNKRLPNGQSMPKILTEGRVAFTGRFTQGQSLTLEMWTEHDMKVMGSNGDTYYIPAETRFNFGMQAGADLSISGEGVQSIATPSGFKNKMAGSQSDDADEKLTDLVKKYSPMAGAPQRPQFEFDQTDQPFPGQVQVDGKLWRGGPYTVNGQRAVTKASLRVFPDTPLEVTTASGYWRIPAGEVATVTTERGKVTTVTGKDVTHLQHRLGSDEGATNYVPFVVADLPEAQQPEFDFDGHAFVGGQVSTNEEGERVGAELKFWAADDMQVTLDGQIWQVPERTLLTVKVEQGKPTVLEGNGVGLVGPIAAAGPGAGGGTPPPEDDPDADKPPVVPADATTPAGTNNPVQPAQATKPMPKDADQPTQSGTSQPSQTTQPEAGQPAGSAEPAQAEADESAFPPAVQRILDAIEARRKAAAARPDANAVDMTQKDPEADPAPPRMALGQLNPIGNLEVPVEESRVMRAAEGDLLRLQANQMTFREDLSKRDADMVKRLEERLGGRVTEVIPGREYARIMLYLNEMPVFDAQEQVVELVARYLEGERYPTALFTQFNQWADAQLDNDPANDGAAPEDLLKLMDAWLDGQLDEDTSNDVRGAPKAGLTSLSKWVKAQLDADDTNDGEFPKDLMTSFTKWSKAQLAAQNPDEQFKILAGRLRTQLVAERANIEASLKFLRTVVDSDEKLARDRIISANEFRAEVAVYQIALRRLEQIKIQQQLFEDLVKAGGYLPFPETVSPGQSVRDIREIVAPVRNPTDVTAREKDQLMAGIVGHITQLLDIETDVSEIKIGMWRQDFDQSKRLFNLGVMPVEAMEQDELLAAGIPVMRAQQQFLQQRTLLLQTESIAEKASRQADVDDAAEDLLKQVQAFEQTRARATKNAFDRRVRVNQRLDRPLFGTVEIEVARQEAAISQQRALYAQALERMFKARRSVGLHLTSPLSTKPDLDPLVESDLQAADSELNRSLRRTPVSRGFGVFTPGTPGGSLLNSDQFVAPVVPGLKDKPTQEQIDAGVQAMQDAQRDLMATQAEILRARAKQLRIRLPIYEAANKRSRFSTPYSLWEIQFAQDLYNQADVLDARADVLDAEAALSYPVDRATFENLREEFERRIDRQVALEISRVERRTADLEYRLNAMKVSREKDGRTSPWTQYDLDQTTASIGFLKNRLQQLRTMQTWYAAHERTGLPKIAPDRAVSATRPSPSTLEFLAQHLETPSVRGFVRINKERGRLVRLTEGERRIWLSRPVFTGRGDLSGSKMKFVKSPKTGRWVPQEQLVQVVGDSGPHAEGHHEGYVYKVGALTYEMESGPFVEIRPGYFMSTRPLPLGVLMDDLDEEGNPKYGLVYHPTSFVDVKDVGGDLQPETVLSGATVRKVPYKDYLKLPELLQREGELPVTPESYGPNGEPIFGTLYQNGEELPEVRPGIAGDVLQRRQRVKYELRIVPVPIRGGKVRPEVTLHTQSLRLVRPRRGADTGREENDFTRRAFLRTSTASAVLPPLVAALNPVFAQDNGLTRSQQNRIRDMVDYKQWQQDVAFVDAQQIRQPTFVRPANLPQARLDGYERNRRQRFRGFNLYGLFRSFRAGPTHPRWELGYRNLVQSGRVFTYDTALGIKANIAALQVETARGRGELFQNRFNRLVTSANALIELGRDEEALGFEGGWHYSYSRDWIDPRAPLGASLWAINALYDHFNFVLTSTHPQVRRYRTQNAEQLTAQIQWVNQLMQRLVFRMQVMDADDPRYGFVRNQVYNGLLQGQQDKYDDFGDQVYSGENINAQDEYVIFEHQADLADAFRNAARVYDAAGRVLRGEVAAAEFRAEVRRRHEILVTQLDQRAREGDHFVSGMDAEGNIERGATGESSVALDNQTWVAKVLLPYNPARVWGALNYGWDNFRTKNRQGKPAQTLTELTLRDVPRRQATLHRNILRTQGRTPIALFHFFDPNYADQYTALDARARRDMPLQVQLETTESMRDVMLEVAARHPGLRDAALQRAEHTSNGVNLMHRIYDGKPYSSLDIPGLMTTMQSMASTATSVIVAGRALGADVPLIGTAPPDDFTVDGVKPYATTLNDAVAADPVAPSAAELSIHKAEVQPQAMTVQLAIPNTLRDENLVAMALVHVKNDAWYPQPNLNANELLRDVDHTGTVILRTSPRSPFTGADHIDNRAVVVFASRDDADRFLKAIKGDMPLSVVNGLAASIFHVDEKGKGTKVKKLDTGLEEDAGLEEPGLDAGITEFTASTEVAVTTPTVSVSAIAVSDFTPFTDTTSTLTTTGSQVALTSSTIFDVDVRQRNQSHALETLAELANTWNLSSLNETRVIAISPALAERFPQLQGLAGQTFTMGKAHFLFLPDSVDAAIEMATPFFSTQGEVSVQSIRDSVDPLMDVFETMLEGNLPIISVNINDSRVLQAFQQIIANVSGIAVEDVTLDDVMAFTQALANFA